jgi:hypothetical protein
MRQLEMEDTQKKLEIHAVFLSQTLKGNVSLDDTVKIGSY